MGAKRRYRFKDFQIDELSGVDRPAQEGAKALLMKRAPDAPLVAPPVIAAGDMAAALASIPGAHGKLVRSTVEKAIAEIGKRARLTSSESGHSHLIWNDNVEAGVTTWGKAEGEDYGHEHPFVRNDDGSLTIGEADGHTHSIVSTEKPIAVEPATTTEKKKSEENSMDPKQIEKLQSDLAAEQTKAATLQKQLDEANGKLAQLAKRAPDQVEYTADDGTVFYKNDDPRFVKQAKRADDADRAAVATRLEKRAGEEIPALSLDVADGAALLGAVEKVADEEARKRIVAALKGASATIGKLATTKRGDGGEKPAGETPATAVAEFDAAVTKLTKEKGISKAKATIEASNAFPDLYKRVSEERRVASGRRN